MDMRTTSASCCSVRPGPVRVAERAWMLTWDSSPTRMDTVGPRRSRFQLLITRASSVMSSMPASRRRLVSKTSAPGCRSSR